MSSSSEIPSTPQPDTELATPPASPDWTNQRFARRARSSSPEPTPRVCQSPGISEAPPLTDVESAREEAPPPQRYSIPRSRPAPEIIHPAPAPPRPQPERNLRRTTQRQRPNTAFRRAIGPHRNPEQDIQRARKPTFRCRDCSVSCNSRAAFVDHLNGRKHLNARLRKQGLPKCNDCNRIFESDNHYQRHIRGKEHSLVVATQNK